MFPVATEASHKTKGRSLSLKEGDQFQAQSELTSNSDKVASPMLQEAGGSSSDIFYYTARFDCSSTFAQALSFQKGTG